MSPPLPATRPLYHQDGTQLTFTARVLATSDREISGQEIALDATAFYPAGGGQAADTGWLRWPGGAAQVLDTRKDKASGVIWHQLAGDLPALDTDIAGEVNAQTRWRHMQRHSGEHLLAQAFLRVSPAFQVVSVGMAGPECHLDLLGEPAESDIRAAEQLLREQLGRDELTLEVPMVPEAELGRYPLRRETKVRDTVRLVIFRDAQGDSFDVSACGGTHVPRAAMCAPVVILRTERVKGGLTRVTFMAGEEASAYLSGVYQGSRAVAQSLSVPVEGLGERVGALLAERDSLRESLEEVRRKLAGALVAAAPSEEIGGVRCLSLQVTDPELLGPVLSQVPAGAVLLAVHAGGHGDTGRGEAVRCGVASRAEGVAAGEILRAALLVSGGKGGGRGDMAQGQTPEPELFLQAAQQAVMQRVGG